MAKLQQDSKMPDFEYNTPFHTGLTLCQTVEKTQGKTALVFLRYYGCTLCQLDLRRYRESYDQITAGGGQLLVVLQSDPKALAEQIGPDTFPFAIVCDPEQKLYKELDIGVAKSTMELADAKTIAKIAQAKKLGLEHGTYEGEELQLPAVFVMDRERNLTFAHYGSSAGDVPDAEQLAELLK